MRIFLRVVFALTMACVSSIGISILVEMDNFDYSIAVTALIPIGGVTAVLLAYSTLYIRFKYVFWVLAIPYSASVFILIYAAYMDLEVSEFPINTLRTVTGTLVSAFWYEVSGYFSRLRKPVRCNRETPSQAELRLAQENRDHTWDDVEKEHNEKMLASLPEAEREALLQKQKEYEKQLNKHGN